MLRRGGTRAVDCVDVGGSKLAGPALAEGGICVSGSLKLPVPACTDAEDVSFRRLGRANSSSLLSIISITSALGLGFNGARNDLSLEAFVRNIVRIEEDGPSFRVASDETLLLAGAFLGDRCTGCSPPDNDSRSTTFGSRVNACARESVPERGRCSNLLPIKTVKDRPEAINALNANL
jgi:hypothetical protein